MRFRNSVLVGNRERCGNVRGNFYGRIADLSVIKLEELKEKIGTGNVAT